LKLFALVFCELYSRFGASFSISNKIGTVARARQSAGCFEKQVFGGKYQAISAVDRLYFTAKRRRPVQGQRRF
jgi:hypothetical protein